MKYFLFPWLMVCGFALAARAECIYLRASIKLLSCELVDSKKIQQDYPYEDMTPFPELAEDAAKTFVRASCQCEYTLKGSSLRCDMDQTIEKGELMASPTPDAVCRRGKSLCREICPKTLP